MGILIHGKTVFILIRGPGFSTSMENHPHDSKMMSRLIVTHICVVKLTIIDSDNGLSPGRRQAIVWTNAVILSIGPLGTNFSEILNKIIIFSFKKMRSKVSSGKRRPSCLGLNVIDIIKGQSAMTRWCHHTELALSSNNYPFGKRDIFLNWWLWLEWNVIVDVLAQKKSTGNHQLTLTGIKDPLWGKSTAHRWSPRKGPIILCSGVFCFVLLLLLLTWTSCWTHSQVTSDLIRHESHVTSVFLNNKVHGAHLGPVGPRLAPYLAHEPRYQGLSWRGSGRSFSFFSWIVFRKMLNASKSLNKQSAIIQERVN